jgi:hypothetical protein
MRRPKESGRHRCEEAEVDVVVVVLGGRIIGGSPSTQGRSEFRR